MENAGNSDRPRPVIRSLSFRMARWGLVIVGSSGSGKSTLLHILGTLDTASSGVAKIKNQKVAKLSRTEQAAFRNQNLGFIYQFHHLLMEFSAVENVAMPLLIKGLSAKEAKAQALEMLEKVGLD